MVVLKDWLESRQELWLSGPVGLLYLRYVSPVEHVGQTTVQMNASLPVAC